MTRVPAAVVAILLVSSVASAQIPGSAAPGQPSPPFPGVPVAPRDNPNTEKAGTAVLRGRVVAADTGQPLRKAQVRLSPNAVNTSGPFIISTGPGGARATSTDANGRYEFKDLAAGR